MARRVQIDLYSLYEQQRLVKQHEAQFKVLNCGRRGGKTTFLDNEAWETVLMGQRAAYYGYSYKTLREAWKLSVEVLSPIIKDKDEGARQLTTINGGRLDFWSSRDPRSGRGKKYHKVIGDEVAFWLHPNESIYETILPTLADYGGDLILASTPYGTGNFWHKICTEPPEGFEIFSWTIYDNPFMNAEFIEMLKRVTDSDVWQQEYLAQFIDIGGEKFFWNYDKSRHEADKDYKLHQAPTWLAFDFNYDPCTCTVYQVIGHKIRAVREYAITGGTEALCRYMKTQDIMNIDRSFWSITGDSSGMNRSATSGNVNNYDIILKEFNMSKRSLVDVQGRNSAYGYSRVLCNQFLSSVDFTIGKSLTGLKRDLTIAKPNLSGGLYKKREDGHGQDLGDTFRYFVNAMFKGGIEAIAEFVAHNYTVHDPDIPNMKEIIAEQQQVFERNKRGVYVPRRGIGDDMADGK